MFQNQRLLSYHYHENALRANIDTCSLVGEKRYFYELASMAEPLVDLMRRGIGGGWQTEIQFAPEDERSPVKVNHNKKGEEVWHS